MAGMSPQPVAEAAPDDESNVSPEEQQSYDDFVLSAMALIYEEKAVRPSILKLLDEEPSDLMSVLGNVGEVKFTPTVAVAATTVVLVMQLIEIAGDEPISDDVLFNASAEVVEELAAISSGMGNSFDEDTTNQAFLMAADLYREVAAEAGLVDKAELAGLFEDLKTADQEGRLGEVLPALDEVNRAAAMDAEAATVEGEVL